MWGWCQKQKSVEVRIRDKKDIAAGLEELKTLVQPLQGTIFGGSAGANLEVKQVTPQGLISIAPTVPAVTARLSSAIGAAMEIVRRRVDALGTTEPTIQRQGDKRILVQVPGFDDPQKLKSLLEDPGVLNFQMVDETINPIDAVRNGTPPGSKLYQSTEGPTIAYVLEERVVVSGEDLVDAQPGFDQRTNEPIVTFRFNASGALRFGEVTQENVGQRFAIVLDGKVISAPVIREPIRGGSGQISGNFTVESANNLSILLRSGSLPAPLTIIEERTVGPSLGADSIAAGKLAAIFGLIGVLIFISIAYGQFGLYANVALLINIALIVGVLSLLQATLTLPGIAGIVLTMGMAVDANVLIFERIREELRNGKTVINAIESGYSRALGTILDANITTLIAALVLFWLGSGPVRGFAITLSIGIITSVFTAFTLTRWLVSWWVRSRRSKNIEIPI